MKKKHFDDWMSGAGRRSKYRKHVEKDVLEGLPEPQEGEQIVQVVCSRGGNLLEVTAPDGTVALCMLPTRYRNLVYVKRGDFLIAGFSQQEFRTANNGAGKVKYTVVHTLFKDQIKHLKSRLLWPQEFEEQVEVTEEESDETLFVNRNRRNLVESESSGSSEDD